MSEQKRGVDISKLSNEEFVAYCRERQICTDCGADLDKPEEQELGVCNDCLRRIRQKEGRCPDCGQYTCICERRGGETR